MRLTRSGAAIMMLSLGLSALLNLWVGLSLSLLLAFLLGTLHLVSRRNGQKFQGHSALGGHDLSIMVAQLRDERFEGEIFGLNGRLRNQISQEAHHIDMKKQGAFQSLIQERSIVNLFFGLQAISIVFIIASTEVRFDQVGFLVLLLLLLINHVVLKDQLEEERGGI